MKYSPITRLLYIIQKSDPKPIELINFILIISWGILVIAAPGPSLSSQAFRILSEIAPEDVWGLIAITIGVLALYGLLFDGITFRYWMLFVKAVFWSCLFMATILGNYMAPAWLFYFVLALSSGWAFIRLRDHSNEWTK